MSQVIVHPNNGWDAPGVTMESLSRLLSDNLDRTAVDKTGISGTFDVHLDLSAADLGHPSPADPPPEAGDVVNSVRNAVQKLGLRLDPEKGTGQVLVIDRVERPSGN